MAGFIFQPTCIPSTDEHWKAVTAIEHGYKTIVQPQQKVTASPRVNDLIGSLWQLTGHKGLGILKKLTEIPLPALRYTFCSSCSI